MAKVSHWGWIGQTESEINNNGVIDEQARRVFVRGQCHALALAIRELTGWPLFGLVDRRDGNSQRSPGHVVVRTPSGAYIDINGKGAAGRWKKRYPRAKLYRLYPCRIRNGMRGYLPADIKAATPFAKTVLKEHCGKDV